MYMEFDEKNGCAIAAIVDTIYIYNIHVYILAASCWINQITKALDIVSTTYGAYFSMSKAKKDMNPKYLYSECMKAPLRVIYIKSDGMS